MYACLRENTIFKLLVQMSHTAKLYHVTIMAGSPRLSAPNSFPAYTFQLRGPDEIYSCDEIYFWLCWCGRGRVTDCCRPLSVLECKFLLGEQSTLWGVSFSEMMKWVWAKLNLNWWVKCIPVAFDDVIQFASCTGLKWERGGHVRDPAEADHSGPMNFRNFSEF